MTTGTAIGLLEGSSVQRVADTWQHNPFAEPMNYAARIDNVAVYATAFERDLLGRIARKTETIGGATTASDYGYDLAGRLDTVTVNGIVRADYAYDSNSNRTAVVYRDAAGTPTTHSGVYDAQDRMASYGPWTFQYGANGELSRRTLTATAAQTNYVYDEFGNLRAVSLPDGRAIAYIDDVFNPISSAIPARGLSRLCPLPKRGHFYLARRGHC